MKIIISHPTSNQNNRAILQSLLEKDYLEEYFTTVASFPGSLLYSLGGFKALSDIRRRSFNPELKNFTTTSPLPEMTRLVLNKLKLNNYTRHETGSFCVDAVYQHLDRKVGQRLKSRSAKEVGAVYAYEDGALQSFRMAKKKGLTCIYELPIAYWETARNLLNEEATRLPKWAITLGGGIKDSEEKLQRKTQELELADIVIGPGKFVMDSLPYWAKSKKLIISPFGSPHFESSQEVKKQNPEKPLRILFVGSMGQRKGLGDLFAAMQKLKNENVEFIVLGSLLAPLEFYKQEYPHFVYEPGRSHIEVLKLMRTCDVLCLPSIVEGRALVMQEAMSQGLPIVITPNTGGEDLVKEGETGFLIPIRNPDKLAEKIMWFVDNRSCVAEMGYEAKLWAQNYTWERYSDKIVEGIASYFKETDHL